MLSLQISHPKKLRDRKREVSLLRVKSYLYFFYLLYNIRLQALLKTIKQKEVVFAQFASPRSQLRNQGETGFSQKDQSVFLYFVGYTNKLKLETERKGGTLLLLGMKSETSWMRKSQNAH